MKMAKLFQSLKSFITVFLVVLPPKLNGSTSNTYSKIINVNNNIFGTIF